MCKVRKDLLYGFHGDVEARYEVHEVVGKSDFLIHHMHYQLYMCVCVCVCVYVCVYVCVCVCAQ